MVKVYPQTVEGQMQLGLDITNMLDSFEDKIKLRNLFLSDNPVELICNLSCSQEIKNKIREIIIANDFYV